MKKQKLIAGLLVASVFANSQTAFTQYINMDLVYNGQTHKYSADEVKIMIDGVELVPEDMPPIIIDGFTMLPMRLIVEALDGEAVWNEETQQAFAITDDIVATFNVGGDEAFRNEELIIMSAPAMIINSRTMLPVRGVAETLGLEIGWDGEERTVYIGEQPEKEADEDIEEDIEDAEEDANDELKDDIGHTSDIVQTAIIENINFPYSVDDVQAFRIISDETISWFEEVSTDDDTKIVIDIHKATNKLSSEYTTTNSDYVSAIRIGNHDDDGVARTRVVFDLVDAEKPYEIYKSYDGKEIIVSFDKIDLEDMMAEYSDDTDSDVVTITSNGKTFASTVYMSDPSRIVVTISNVGNGVEKSLDPTYLKYIENISIAKLDNYTSEAVIKIVSGCVFNVVDEMGKLTISITESALDNIVFNEENISLELNGKIPINIDEVEIFDNYNLDYTEIQFKDNYISDYGDGIIQVDNELTESIEIKQNDIGTIIRFNQNYYSGYVIQETSSGYEILIRKPKDAYDKVIMIDAGHGGQDGGTTGNGLIEKELNLSLVLKIEKYLEDSGIHVYQTRSDDSYPALSWRSPTATDIAHIMLSVHHNAATSSTANGTETFYMVNDNETNPTENQLTSKLLAETIQSAVVKTLGTTNRGVKSNPAYIILNKSEIPTVLAEIGFLTNYGDALKVSSEANQELIAKNIADGIIDLFNNYEPPK